VLQPRPPSFRQYLSASPSAHLRQSVVVATATVSTPSAQGNEEVRCADRPYRKEKHRIYSGLRSSRRHREVVLEA
jgi:hypothetical protein